MLVVNWTRKLANLEFSDYDLRGALCAPFWFIVRVCLPYRKYSTPVPVAVTSFFARNRVTMKPVQSAVGRMIYHNFGLPIWLVALMMFPCTRLSRTISNMVGVRAGGLRKRSNPCQAKCGMMVGVHWIRRWIISNNLTVERIIQRPIHTMIQRFYITGGQLTGAE